MLTIKEIKEVNSLFQQNSDYEDILRGFKRHNIKTSVGLVSFHTSSRHNIVPCDQAELFETHFADVIKVLTDQVQKAIEHRIKEVDLELSKYIKQDTTPAQT